MMWPISQQCGQKAREMLQTTKSLRSINCVLVVATDHGSGFESSGCLETYRSNHVGGQNELPLEDKGSH